jgi:hypothetical protein
VDGEWSQAEVWAWTRLGGKLARLMLEEGFAEVRDAGLLAVRALQGAEVRVTRSLTA